MEFLQGAFFHSNAFFYAPESHFSKKIIIQNCFLLFKYISYKEVVSRASIVFLSKSEFQNLFE
jgi:hypothetical protein